MMREDALDIDAAFEFHLSFGRFLTALVGFVTN
jgi:hypothetical protein